MKHAVHINLNDTVLVKVTPAGWAYAEAQWAIFNAQTGRSLPFALLRDQHQPDRDGWSRWQLWELANTFGAEMFNGNMALPIEMNAILIVDAPAIPATPPAPAANGQG